VGKEKGISESLSKGLIKKIKNAPERGVFLV